MTKNITWTSKYVPQSLDEMILDNASREFFQSYVNDNTLPNITLCGYQGLGKTTIAKILSKTIDATVLYICGSQEAGVDTVRNKIEKFANSKGFAGSQKVVIIDEADGMTNKPEAQKALRNTMTEHENDTKFILTCNNLNGIHPAILSRCKPMSIVFDIKDVARRMFEILEKEKIKLDETGKKQVLQIVKKCYPDIRLTITTLEHFCSTGEFKIFKTGSTEEIDKIVKLINADCWKDNVRKIREYYIKLSSQFGSDYLKLIKSFIDVLEDPIEQLIATKYAWRISQSLDGEIHFYGFILCLNQHRNGKTVFEKF